MGVDEYRQEFYLAVDLQEILNTAKIWLRNNTFKIKEEIPNTYLNSYAGGYLGLSDRGTRRWLEVHVNHLPAGNYVQIHEKVSTGASMVGKLIKEEVLELTGFLQSTLKASPQTISHPINLCPHCHAPIKIPGSKFCESCGREIKSVPIIRPATGSFKFCIYCGAQIPSIAVFCEKCGANLESSK